MNKLKLYTCIASLFILSNVTANAATNCQSFNNTLSDILDENSKGKELNSINGDYRNISSIIKHLGKTKARQIDVTNMTWGDFIITAHNGKSIKITGNFPPELNGFSKSNLPTLRKAKRLLGKPDNEKTAKQYLYHWTCDMSYLWAITDKSKNIISLTGANCIIDENNPSLSPIPPHEPIPSCKTFNLSYANSKLSCLCYAKSKTAIRIIKL